MTDKTTITILGAGYVGLTSAALLAYAGHKVYLIEPNTKRLNTIKEGHSFFFEAGLDPLIRATLDTGNLIPTDSYKESIPNSSLVFSCVGTPDNPDGSSNLTYIFEAATEAAKYLKPGSIYIQKSTVPVGTGTRIEDLFVSLDVAAEYVSNPEFLREGSALSDTLFFDRVVAGGSNQKAVETVLDVYRELERHRSAIAEFAAIPLIDEVGSYISTNLNSAELIKVTANAFLALKISFANSIAKLADQANADIKEVMNAVGADKRIGKAFLNAGRGYGGGCFPKDVSGLIASGLEYGVNLEIMQAAQAVNESMPGYIIDKLQQSLTDELKNQHVAVLGLSFKAGTSDVRRSPGVIIANILAEHGATVSAYDPQANNEAKDELKQSIKLVETLQEAIADATVILVATEWGEFDSYPAASFAKNSKAKIIVDAVNKLDATAFQAAGFQYIGVGR